jgi:hypothetical protein
MVSRIATGAILIGVASVAELCLGLLRHAVTLLWPRAGDGPKIVASATI